MLLVSSCRVPLRRPSLLPTCHFPHIPLPPSLIPVLLRPLLVLSLLLMLMRSVVSLRRGLFIGMLRSLLSWRLPLGLPPLSLLPLISLTFNSLLHEGLVWVRWWLRVLWYRFWFLFVLCVLFLPSFLVVLCSWG